MMIQIQHDESSNRARAVCQNDAGGLDADSIWVEESEIETQIAAGAGTLRDVATALREYRMLADETDVRRTPFGEPVCMPGGWMIENETFSNTYYVREEE